MRQLCQHTAQDGQTIQYGFGLEQHGNPAEAAQKSSDRQQCAGVSDGRRQCGNALRQLDASGEQCGDGIAAQSERREERREQQRHQTQDVQRAQNA